MKECYASDFMKKSSYSVLSFTEDYLSVPECPGS